MKGKILVMVVLVLLCIMGNLLLSMAEEMGEDYIKPEIVLIDGGTFEMGSESGEDLEKPVHSVTVDGVPVSFRRFVALR